MSALRALNKLLVAHKEIGDIIVMDRDNPICLTGAERTVVSLILNEMEDDLEVLCENWGLTYNETSMAPIPSVRMIDYDDERYDDGTFDDDDWLKDMMLEDQELADFAMDRDEDNFDHEELDA